MWDNWVFEQRLSDREPNKPRVTLTDVCAKPGETFSTTLRFENCDFDGPYETFVNFNKNIMRFSSVSGEGVTASLIKDGQLLVSCNNPEKETVLHFKLKPGMEEGTYSLATIPKTKYGDGLFMLNSDCKLMIYNDILGDLNGNGIVDETDAVLLGRWLAGWNVEITENAANVNRDGGVTEEDAVMMSRYFAGHRISFGERK